MKKTVLFFCALISAGIIYSGFAQSQSIGGGGTNPEIGMGTNGFVTASVTNGLASTNYVNSQGFVTQTITNGLDGGNVFTNRVNTFQATATNFIPGPLVGQGTGVISNFSLISHSGEVQGQGSGIISNFATIFHGGAIRGLGTGILTNFSNVNILTNGNHYTFVGSATTVGRYDSEQSGGWFFSPTVRIKDSSTSSGTLTLGLPAAAGTVSADFTLDGSTGNAAINTRQTSSTLTLNPNASGTAGDGTINLKGKIVVGNGGTTVSNFLSASYTFDPPSITEDLTFTTNVAFSGVVFGQSLAFISLPAAPTAGIDYRCNVASNGFVAISMGNYRDLAVDPASQTVTIFIINQ